MADHQQIAVARQLEAGGDFNGALAAYEALLKKHPGASDLYFAVGNLYHNKNDMTSALKYVDKAIRIDASRAHYHALRGTVLTAFSRVDEGLEAAERALSLNPDDPMGLFVKAELLRVENRSAEVIEMLEPRFGDREKWDPRLVFTYAHCLGNEGRAEEGIELLERMRERPNLADQALSNIGFKLGLLYDKVKRHDDAFVAYAEGNSRRHAVHDAELEDRKLERRIAVWTRGCLDKLPHARVKSEVPVFIVGMPRSGTTLTEQIIGSHPEAFGGGERHNIVLAGRELLDPNPYESDEEKRLENLKQAAIDRVARRELREMQRIGDGPKRFTDKLPQNFLNIGLIELLFPGARIIHCKRDPMDNCVSCFFQDFGGAENQGYSYDLGHLGRYYRNYVALMEHWKRVTALPLLEVQYEETVADQEGMSRRIIDFVGLDWDDACLQFHKSERKVVTLSSDQVRKPMYTSSVKRWERYERHLDPLREALGDLVED